MYLPSYLIAPDTFNPYNNPQFPHHHQQSLYSTLNLSQSVQSSLCGYCCPTSTPLSTSSDLSYYQNHLDHSNLNGLLEQPSALILSNFTEISLCDNNLKNQQFIETSRRTSTTLNNNRSIQKDTMVRSFEPHLQTLNNLQNGLNYHQLLAMPTMFYTNTHNPPTTAFTYLVSHSPPLSYHKVHV